MRNQKKWIAVLTVACMVLPSATAFAAAPTPTYPPDSTLEGGGVVEFDPETLVEFINIVLPTQSSTAYDFTMDPTHLLPDYSNEYNNTYSAYFKSQSAAASLEYVGSQDDAHTTAKSKLFIKKPKEAANQSTTELANVVKPDGSGTAYTVTSGYYVWVPDTANGKAPQGKFEPLTKSNVEQYLDFTYVAADNTVTPAVTESLTFNGTGFKRSNVNTSQTPATTVEGVFDGKLYKDTFEELTAPYTATDYVTLNAAGDTITAFDTTNQLYFTTDSADLTDSTKFTALAAAHLNDVEYTAAATGYTDTSDVATIVNKSSNDTTVKVTATLTQVGALNLTDDDTFGASGTHDDKASLYLAVKMASDSSESAIVSDGATTPVYKTEVTCDLNGANDVTDYIAYQSGIDSATGGHNYVRYTKQDITYGSESFSLVAKTNTNTEAADAWKEYSKGLTGSGDRPKVSVVYHVEKKTGIVSLNFKQWANDDLWFGDGLFTDRSKLTSIVAVETDGTESNEITVKGDDGNGYLNVTWSGITAAGHPSSVTTGYKLRVVYNGTTYELDL